MKKTQNRFSTITNDENVFTTSFKETIELLINVHFPDNKHAKTIKPTKELDPIELGKVIFTTPTEIINNFKQFGPKKAPGIDGFDAKILLNCIETAPITITKIYNKILTLGYFPKNWNLNNLVLRAPNRLGR